MHRQVFRATRASLWVALFALALLFVSRPAGAVPQAHLLRVDPRAGMNDGSPVLTTLIELGQFKTISDVLGGCSETRNRDALYDCWGDAVEKPNSLWEPFQFPDTAAKLLVRVEGSESPAKFVSKTVWKDAQKETGIGTAWLIGLDASNSMGSRYGDGREVVVQFLQQMGPQDLIRLILFDDRDQAFMADSKWKSYKERNDIITKVLNVYQSNAPSSGQSRAIFNTVKNILTTGFNDLGNVGSTVTIPIHQAFVLLSNGAGRQDALSNAGGGEQLKKYANNGRFPDDNTSSPKTPLPIVSILFPNPTGGLANSLMANNDVQFMQSLANPETGGFFSVVRAGQGKARGERIAKAVKSRYNSMSVVKWRLACLNPTVEQTFNLTFSGLKQTVLPDGSFKGVPIGVDPSQWPLDINVQQTVADANNNPLYPGGTFKVYGDFCWAGDKGRAESYFIPAGTKADPGGTHDADAAKKMMQNLAAQNMRGSAEEANSTFVLFRVPNDDKLLEGSGDATVARVVVFDNRANRASGFDDKTILQLKAKKAPLPIWLIGAIVGAVVVIGLLVMVLLRGGGNKRRGGGGGGGGTPAPVIAGGVPPYGGGGGGGYGAPPGGYGGQPGGGPPYGGGGYGAMAEEAPPVVALPLAAPALESPAKPPFATPFAAPAAAALVAPPAEGVLNVRCPSCKMLTMTMPGTPGVCFSCGQPLPANVGPQVAAPALLEGGGPGIGAAAFPAHRRHGRAGSAPSTQSLRSVRRSSSGGERRSRGPRNLGAPSGAGPSALRHRPL